MDIPIEDIIAAITMIVEMIQKCQEAQAVNRIKSFGLGEIILVRIGLRKLGWDREKIKAMLKYIIDALKNATDEDILAFVKDAQSKVS